MFIKIEKYNVPQDFRDSIYMFECDRFIWKTVIGDATKLGKEAADFADKHGEPGGPELPQVIGKISGKGRDLVSLIMLYGKGKPRPISAIHCNIFIMNDSGEVIDSRDERGVEKTLAWLDDSRKGSKK